MVSGRVKKFNSELSFRVWPLFSLHLHTNMTQERVIYEVSLDIDDDVCIRGYGTRAPVLVPCARAREI